jgi:glucosylceramidase
MNHLLLGLMLLAAALSDGENMATSNVHQVTLIQTSRAGDKLKTVAAGELETAGAAKNPIIELDPSQRFQTLVGIGGSFTESSAHVLKQLSPGNRDSIINAYFSRDGAAYSLTRTHINSCDFSLDHYAYTDTGDTALETFSIDHDLVDLVPLIKDAMNAPGADFKIIASPWTAPPWMKDNNSWYGGSLKTGMEDVWARYFVKYLEAYRDQGIDIWGLTPENEPLGNNNSWDSMHFTPESMRDFIKLHLGPELVKNGWDTKVLIFDQNRDHVEEWVNVILGDPEAAKFVWGTAVHWYRSTYDWYPETLQKVHDAFPDKHLLHSEGCVDNQVPVWQDDDWYWRKEATDWGFTYAREENKHLHPAYVPVYRYARDIIGGLNSWLTGWVDWNIVLDTQGGPNLADNWCCAPVIARQETDEIYFTPMYYTLAQFSKYLRPGAVRIGVESELEEIMVTAVENPDGSFVAVILNQTAEPLDYVLRINGKQMKLNIPGAALQTVVLE